MDSKTTVTVSGLTKYIKNRLESDVMLTNISVSGEISNLTVHRTGHLYLALKDENAIISAVMFRGFAASLDFKPENGMKVIAKGKISVFEPSGRYQLMISSMQVDGVGDLYIAYERLKEKLQAEGLFDSAHKRPLPKIPRRIGVVTSPTGAAIRDIIHVTGRRFPYADLLIYPSLVQGEGAPAQLCRALAYFEQTQCVDVVIIGRGGGSIEDLWAFNDETLARYIYSMTVPVISAVGHEIDFTICDFVADMRAPTPSAAAEIAVPDTADMLIRFENVNKHLKSSLLKKAQWCRERYESLIRSRVFSDVSVMMERRHMLLDRSTEQLFAAFQGRVGNSVTAFTALAGKLDALSPLKVLRRGYLIAQTDTGKTVKSTGQIRAGDTLRLRLCDGQAKCTVNELTKGENNG